MSVSAQSDQDLRSPPTEFLYTLEYSRVLLSRSPRGSLKYFEITAPRHIFAELRKNTADSRYLEFQGTL